MRAVAGVVFVVALAALAGAAAGRSAVPFCTGTQLAGTFKDVRELARMLHEAFYVAKSGRPGPVVVDLPKDVLFAPGPYTAPEEVRHKSYRPQLLPDPGLLLEELLEPRRAELRHLQLPPLGTVIFTAVP